MEIFFYAVGLILILYNVSMIVIGEIPEINLDEEFDETNIDECIKRLKVLV